jgi:hypothetical protein
VSVPLALFDRPIGVITLVTGLGHQFTQEDLALLSTIAVGLSLSAAGFILPQSEPTDPVYATSMSLSNGQLKFADARVEAVSVGS